MSTTDVRIDQLQIFFGELTAAEARVYVQFPRPGNAGEFRLQGVVSGPRCRYARTLAARVPLRAITANDSLMAQAIVPDPCCWTADMPFLYDVTVQVLQDGAVIAEVTQPLGFRPLAASRRGLRLGGANWVLRGAGRDTETEAGLAEWRHRDTALVLPAPNDELCRAASDTGVLLVAEIAGSDEQIARELQRIARHPAVGFAIFNAEVASPTEFRLAGRNLVLVQPLELEGMAVAPWAQAVVADATDLARFVELFDRVQLPVIARRSIDQATAPVDSRAACDRLQRDVVEALRSRGGRVEPAGYLV